MNATKRPVRSARTLSRNDTDEVGDIGATLTLLTWKRGMSNPAPSFATDCLIRQVACCGCRLTGMAAHMKRCRQQIDDDITLRGTTMAHAPRAMMSCLVSGRGCPQARRNDAPPAAGAACGGRCLSCNTGGTPSGFGPA